MSRPRRRVWLALLGALAWAEAAVSEAPNTVVLTFVEQVAVRQPPPHGEAAFERSIRVSFGPPYIREDVGDEGSYILDRATQRVFVLDHRARTWQVYPLPVRLEDHLSREQADLLALHARRLDRLDSEPPAREAAAGRAAVRSTWTAVLGEVEIAASWWLAEIEGIDAEGYRILSESIAAMHPVHRVWSSKVELPAGLPVRQLLVTEGRFGERRERVLEGIELLARPLDFRAPAGYRQRPTHCFRHLDFGDDPACR